MTARMKDMYAPVHIALEDALKKLWRATQERDVSYTALGERLFELHREDAGKPPVQQSFHERLPKEFARCEKADKAQREAEQNLYAQLRYHGEELFE